MSAAKQVTIQDSTAAARAEIAEVREQIEARQMERDELQSGYLPETDVRQRISDAIDLTAQKIDAEYGIGALLRSDGRPSDFSLLELHTRVGVYEHSIPEFAPLVAFLFGDTIKQRLCEFASTLDLPPGPTAADRPRLIEKIDRKILQLEQKEEALIVAAEQAGLDVMRHPSANPAVILEWVD